jgi:mRNA interferase RelE/StbE
MQTIDTQKFNKSLAKLPAADQIAVLDALDDIESAEVFGDIPNLKPLKGYKNYFRLRVGNWRVGLFWTGDAFSVEDVGKRGDFYNGFP